MLAIDLHGRRALVAGVADDKGYGFAIAKALAEAGASVCVGTWPPTWNIFAKLIERGKLDRSRKMRDGRLLEFERIYPLDAAFDTLEDVPEDDPDQQTLSKRRRLFHRGPGVPMAPGFRGRIAGYRGAFPGQRSGSAQPSDRYESQRLPGGTERQRLLHGGDGSPSSPLMSSGGAFMALSYLAGQRVIPGYGGGMSSAKAALESDVRVLAHEAGRRYGLRVNCISAGPLASRAASAIGEIDRMVDYVARNAPLPESLRSNEVGQAAAFLCSPLASGITGTVLYVDKGYHAMGMPVDQSLL
jgi:enoyl-[acyl-carrier protein] reductase I